MPTTIQRVGRRGLLTLALTWAAGAAEPVRPPPPVVEFLYGGRELFPSVLVSTTENCRYLPRDEKQLGDPTGVIAVRVTAPVANARVRVTLAETALFAESSVSELLPKAGEEVFIAPTVRWHHERLARLKQPIANFVIKATVEIEGQRQEHYVKTVVHSINDWLQRYRLRGQGDWTFSAKFLAAAFVNENNPNLDRVVTRQAMSRGFVASFKGYSGENRDKDIKAKVDRQELAAIYQALQALGFKYTATTQASYISQPKLADARVLAQNVRLVNDALESRQATGLEGATLLASAYVKLGLNVVVMLVAIPNENRSRALLGVFEQRPFETGELDLADLLVIDASSIGALTFKEALALGKKVFDENKAKLEPLPPDASPGRKARRHSEEATGNLWIDIRQARRDGVLPIPEFEK